MAILYQKGEVKSFYKRRAKRLLPAYFATVIATLIFSLIIVRPSELPQVVNQSIYSLFFANNIGFWMQNSYFSKSFFNPLLHLWSLGVEIQFYLVVPLLVWFFRKSNIILFLAFIVSFLLCLFVVGISPKTSFFMMPLRMWEFLVGFIIACFLTSNGNVKYQSLSWLGLIGLTVICLIPFIKINGDSLNRFNGHPSLTAFVVCIATGLVLGFGLPKIFEHNIFGRSLSRIGDYSYSIYLVHFPIIVLYLYQPFMGTLLHPNNVIDQIVLGLFIIVASILMYNFIEKRSFENIKHLYLSSFATSFLIFSIAIYTVPQFYNPQDKNLYAGVNDKGQYRCGKINRIINSSAISCKINKQKFKQSVLLVGNSHANAIKESFSEVAEKYEYNTYFLVDNTPLMKGHKIVTPKILIDEAKRLKISHLIVHSSPNSTEFSTIEKLLKLAKSNDINVDFILPIPVYNKPVPKIIYENNFDELYTGATYLSSNKKFIDGMNTLSQQYDNFRVFNSYQVFCKDGSLCKVADDERHPFYHDSNHLSLTGAKEFKPVFEEIFKSRRLLTRK